MTSDKHGQSDKRCRAGSPTGRPPTHRGHSLGSDLGSSLRRSRRQVDPLDREHAWKPAALTTEVDKVKKGKWISYVKKYFMRNARMVVCHEDYDFSELEFKEIDTASVDTGQVAIVDKPFYRNDDAVDKSKVGSRWKPKGIFKDKDGEWFYGLCATLTTSTKSAGIVPHGFVSTAGFGDGGYPIFAAKNKSGQYVAFMVGFILDTFLDQRGKDLSFKS